MSQAGADRICLGVNLSRRVLTDVLGVGLRKRGESRRELETAWGWAGPVLRGVNLCLRLFTDLLAPLFAAGVGRAGVLPLLASSH